MASYLLRRSLYAFATLFVIATATFFLMRSIPGGPFSSERSLPPSVEENLRARYRLNDPLAVQYLRYLGGVVRGDLGPSFVHSDRTTNDIIRDGLPKSALLGLTAFLLAMGAGIPMGVAAALRAGRMSDRALMLAAILGVSLPSFILASLLQYFFSHRLRWLPPAGWGSPLQVIMPAVALAGFKVAFVSRLVRSSMVGVLNDDYIRTARAKGLSGRVVVLRHALRNALLPVVTYAGPMLAALLTGSFIVEDIFAIPGLGRFFVTSITDRDYTVILGVTLFYSTLLVAFNLLVDVLYALADPRISFEAAR
jgi:oligopeptide transport system permease protein